MAKEKNKNSENSSTEEAIKAAARSLFLQKGFAATRTRDIAEEAGINLALLNYYFRSKQKLFEQIMYESLFSFLQRMALIFNDESTTLEEKVAFMADKYIDFFLEEPNIPIFILSELQRDPSFLLNNMPIHEMIRNSSLYRQYRAAYEEGRVIDANVLHFLMNLLGLLVFPFAASPIIRKIDDLDQEEFESLMKARKQLIPRWVMSMISTP